MPETGPVPVKDLAIDLRNFRTIPQPSEASGVEAIISTSPDRFWALTESLLESGYLPTESIIVLREANAKRTLRVKEGSRRIAAMKLIHGYIPTTGLKVPDNIAAAMRSVSKEWLLANHGVPCTIYDTTEEMTVDRIVSLTHGYGEKAGREPWNPVARARHDRSSGGSAPELDLLEKYLKSGKNVTADQAARWAAYYPLSVLEEAAKRLAPRLGLQNAPALARDYPLISHREAVETIFHGIGQFLITFNDVRSPDFGVSLGIPVPEDGAASGAGRAGSKGKKSKKAKKARAYRSSDPKSVRQLLKGFVPRGNERAKVEDLRIEAIALDLKETPLAFCFVVRSMIEISAKAYCGDHAIPTMKAGGKAEKPLIELLRSVTEHLTRDNTDRAMLKELHGALTQLAVPEGLLSVTSMNQLVHNPKFHVSSPGDVATLFGQVFPLIVAMNS